MTSLLLVAVLAWSAAKEVPLAVVVRVKGHVSIGLEKALKPARSGDVLSRRWRVKTEPDGRLLLRFLADKTLVEVRPSSTAELEIREDGQGKTRQNLSLLSGEASFQVPSGAGGRATTETTVSTAKSATEFGMTMASDGTTRVDVVSGVVQVCNQMTGEHALVGAGQSQVSGYEGLEETVSTVSDPGRGPLDVSPNQADSAAPVTELAVPFVDPTTGKTTTLVIGVKRNR